MTGFALGALATASGTLEPGELAQYAARTADNALFVSLTLGLVLGALGPWPPRVEWRSAVCAVPLVAALLATGWSTVRWAPLGLGMIFGALPLFAALALPGGGQTRDSDLRTAAPGWWILITVAIAAAEPLLVTALLPLPWLLPGRRAGWPDAPWLRRVMPAVGTVLLAGMIWLALTVAGTPWVRLADYAVLAPVSIAAERLMAVLALGAVVAFAAPWPLRRFAPVLVPMPAIVLLASRFAANLAPSGMAAWYPGTALVLVPSALIAALLGHWRTALGTVALLGGLLGTPPGLIAGLVLATVAVLPSLRAVTADPVRDRVTFFGSRWLAPVVSAALAGVIVAILNVEVVLATILAGGLALLLARPSAATPPPRPADVIP